MKKNYENPVVDLNEIEEIETAEDNGVSTTQGVEDDLNFWPI